MQFKQLLKDDDAVSPVIGVILMVAITVILAAVIGTFVLGLGDQVQSNSPNTQFEFDQGKTAVDNKSGAASTVDVTSVDITHTSGQKVNHGNIEVTANGEAAVGTEGGGTTTNGDNVIVPWNSGSDVSASDSVTIVASADLASDDSVDDLDNSAEFGEDGSGLLQITDDGTGDLNNDYADTELSEGDTVRVVWESDDGGNSDVLANQEIN